MFENKSAERYQCQHDIAYLAEQFISFPLIGKIVLNKADRILLHSIQTECGIIDLQRRNDGSHPMWRLVSLYLIHQLLFSKSTTFLLVGQNKHLARKTLETLYFPLNHLGLSFLPEIETKYTGCLKLSNDVCVRSIGVDDAIPAFETKEAIVISYGLSEIPTQLQNKKWVQVPEPTST